MLKLLQAVYGDEAADLIKGSFDSLTSEQKYNLLGQIVDTINDPVKGKVNLSMEELLVVMQGLCKRSIEIIPEYKERLEEEAEEFSRPFILPAGESKEATNES